MKKFFLQLILCMVLLLVVPSFADVEGTNKSIKLNTKIYDELETYDEVDYFNFKLSKPGSIKIDFDFDVQGVYIVKLIDIGTERIIQDLTFSSEVNTTSGRYLKSGSKLRLDSGKYQIAVSSKKNNYSDEEYKLKVNYDSESGDSYEKESNDTAKSAMIIDYNRKITGNLESKSDIDFYMVELDRPGSIQLKLQYDKSSQYNVVLYSEIDGKLNQIQSNKFKSGLVMNSDYNVEVSDRIRVSEGNYYIKIFGGFSSSYTDEDYILNVIYSAERYGNYEEEPNDNTNTSTYIYEGERFIGNLSSKSDIDYYYINLWGNKYYVNMEIPEGSEYNMVIYKEENGKLKQVSSNKIDSNNEYIEIKDGKGNYYIKITAKTYSNDDYTIAVLNENNTYIPRTIVLEVNNKDMIVDGKKVSIDGNRGTKPVIINDRMLLPLSAIIENLGGKSGWNEKTRVATFELKGRVIDMPIGSSTAYVNGNEKCLDVPTQTINDRTMAPVRFVTENLGCNVVWNNGKVTINY